MRRKARWLGLSLAIGLIAAGAGAGEPPFRRRRRQRQHRSAAHQRRRRPEPARGDAEEPDVVQDFARHAGGAGHGPRSYFWAGYRLGSVRAAASRPGSSTTRSPRAGSLPPATSRTRATRGPPGRRLEDGVPDLQTPLSDHWYMKAIDLDAANARAGRRVPDIGFSADRVVVQINLYQPARRLLGTRIYVFDKAAMYGGNLTTSTLQHLDRDATLRRSPGAGGDLLRDRDARRRHLRPPGLGPRERGSSACTRSAGPAFDPDLAAGRRAAGPRLVGRRARRPPRVRPQTSCRRRRDRRVRRLSRPPARAGSRRRLAHPERRLPERLRLGGPHGLPRPPPTAPPCSGGRSDPTSPGSRSRAWSTTQAGSRTSPTPSIAVNTNEDLLIGYSRFNAGAYAEAAFSLRTGGAAGQLGAGHRGGRQGLLLQGLRAAPRTTGAPTAARSWTPTTSGCGPSRSTRRFRPLPASSGTAGARVGHPPTPRDLDRGRCGLFEGDSGHDAAEVRRGAEGRPHAAPPDFADGHGELGDPDRPEHGGDARGLRAGERDPRPSSPATRWRRSRSR